MNYYYQYLKISIIVTALLAVLGLPQFALGEQSNENSQIYLPFSTDTSPTDYAESEPMHTIENNNTSGYPQSGASTDSSAINNKKSGKIDKNKSKSQHWEVKLPNMPGASDPMSSIAHYIKYFFVFGLAVSGLAAMLSLIYAGFLWITATGNPTKIQQAKDRILGAITGLLLLTASYVILYTINPDLVVLKELKLEKIKGIPGSGQLNSSLECQWTDANLLEGKMSCSQILGDEWSEKSKDYCPGEKKENYICCCKTGKTTPPIKEKYLWHKGDCSDLGENYYLTSLKNCGDSPPGPDYQCCFNP